MTYRIIVCGSRDWTNRVAFEKALLGVLYRANTSEVEIIHGGCPTGADAMASEFCGSHKIPEKVYPDDWNKFGKRAGPVRNENMALNGADLCLAFWDGISRGTSSMIHSAVKCGIRVLIIPRTKS